MVSRLGKIANSLSKVRDYITLVAYGVVLADVINLVEEMAKEYLMQKRFKHLVHKEIQKISDNDIAKWTEQEKKWREDENVPEKEHFFSEV